MEEKVCLYLKCIICKKETKMIPLPGQEITYHITWAECNGCWQKAEERRKKREEWEAQENKDKIKRRQYLRSKLAIFFPFFYFYKVVFWVAVFCMGLYSVLVMKNSNECSAHLFNHSFFLINMGGVALSISLACLLWMLPKRPSPDDSSPEKKTEMAELDPSRFHRCLVHFGIHILLYLVLFCTGIFSSIFSDCWNFSTITSAFVHVVCLFDVILVGCVISIVIWRSHKQQ